MVQFIGMHAWTPGLGNALDEYESLPYIELGDYTLLAEYKYDSNIKQAVFTFVCDPSYGKGFKKVLMTFDGADSLQYIVETDRPPEFPPVAATHEGFLMTGYNNDETKEFGEFMLDGDGWELYFSAYKVTTIIEL